MREHITETYSGWGKELTGGSSKVLLRNTARRLTTNKKASACAMATKQEGP